MKKVATFIFALGSVMLAFGLSWTALFGNPPEEPWYLAYYFKILVNSVKFGLVFGGSMTVLWGLAGLLFPEQIHGKCGLKTSVVALSISAIVSLGLYCVNLFFSCYFLTDPSEHPIRLPASVILGAVCLLIFMGLLYIYRKRREKNMSKSGITLDFMLMLSYLPVFWCVSGIGCTLLRIPMIIQKGW